MKIFITEHEQNGKIFAGPYICAPSWDVAESAAESVGFTVVGELQDLIPTDRLDRNLM